MTIGRCAASLFFGAIIFWVGAVQSQNFPIKPIRILVGAPGGSNDAAARLIAGGISGPLGQPVIVENRGSGAIAGPAVAQSAPDGYTLHLGGDVLWLGPLLRGQPDAIRDFTPVSLLASAPNVLVVHPSLPVKSVKELIALARAKPGALNYSSGAAGAPEHIAGELFKSMTGTNIVRVPFKGSAAPLIAVTGGEVEMMFGGAFVVSTHVKAGRLRGLAVTSAQPSALVAGLPTMAASGLPGYEIVALDGLYAAAKTPAAIINRLNQEIVRFLHTKEAQEKYLAMGADVVASTPEEHVAKIQSRITTIGKLIKDAGIKVE